MYKVRKGLNAKVILMKVIQNGPLWGLKMERVWNEDQHAGSLFTLRGKN